jgi:asparagine synthase (glutamine-hydrolysing)
MWSRDGRYVIVFNGEIYNFLELKADLEAKGRVFRGHSDTEIMLEAFSEWGVPLSLQKFSGMFAFALWDRQTTRLYLARDRFGEKPLYYGWQGNTFLFGSELKALRQHPAWGNRINRDALTLLMRHNFIPAPHSIFIDIHKLLPGTMLILETATGATTTQTYWSFQQMFESGINHPLTGSPDEMADALESELRGAIKRQMIADVPLGAFLSGGIDSSTIVALMQSIGSSPVKTFTIGFGEEGYNEAHHAKAISQILQTDHTELYVSPDQAREVVPQLPDIYDEPFADSSQIPIWLVARMARSRVTVSLSGDAGDELFGGYQRYHQMLRARKRMQQSPAVIRRAAARLIRAVPQAFIDQSLGAGLALLGQQRYRYIGEKLNHRAEAWLQPTLQLAYQHNISYLRNTGLVLGGHEPMYALNDSTGILSAGTELQQMQYLDAMCYLPDDILTKVDRAAMAHSLETRIPLLDNRVVELATRIPSAVNMLHRDGKWPLRKILSRYVPEQLTERPKQGFAVPVSAWLRDPLKEWGADLLDPARLRAEGFLDVNRVNQQWTRHLKQYEDNSFSLWGILMFESWLEKWQTR